MVRVGLVGCGTIGSRAALALNRKYASIARITALCDTNPAHARRLQRRLTPRPAILPLVPLIRRSDLIIEAASAAAALPVATPAPPPRPAIRPLVPLTRRSDLIMEAASAAAALPVATRALRANRNVLVMSVGGLLGDRTWARIARRSRGRLLIPSGALAGLDGVKAMAVGRPPPPPPGDHS